MESSILQKKRWRIWMIEIAYQVGAHQQTHLYRHPYRTNSQRRISATFPNCIMNNGNVFGRPQDQPLNSIDNILKMPKSLYVIKVCVFFPKICTSITWHNLGNLDSHNSWKKIHGGPKRLNKFDYTASLNVTCTVQCTCKKSLTNTMLLWTKFTCMPEKFPKQS